MSRYISQSKDEIDIKSFNIVSRVVDLNVLYENFADSVISQSPEFAEKDSGNSIKNENFSILIFNLNYM